METIKWPDYDGKYLVHRNGQVWNVNKNRFLKINYNGGVYDYPKVTLISLTGIVTHYNLHSIIAEHFVPKPEGMEGNLEVNHIDMNKQNCDADNLEWTTHQENMRKARKEKSWESSRINYNHSDETKKLMAEKKQKKIILYNDDKNLTFNSIDEFMKEFKTHRKTFNRYVNSHKTWNGFYIRYL
jgi:hypothetical protein